jgi:hypothetical protein
MSEARVVRPGLLISLGTGVKGNTRYYKQQLEAAHPGDGGEQRSRWETTKIVFDPDEQERAEKVRRKARSLIEGVCAYSAFGLLCPEDRAEQLQERIVEARALAKEFNDGANLAHVRVDVIWGRIAQDDVEAVKAISGELRDLMRDMQTGIGELDAKKVRAAANKAVSVGQMLSEDTRERLQDAIKVARREARRIVKAGETVGLAIDRTVIERIEQSRTAFLDLAEPVAVAAPQAAGRAVDFDLFEAPVAAPRLVPALRDLEVG